MRIGKTVIGIVVLVAAAVLFFMGHVDLAQQVAVVGAGLTGVGFADKLDKLIAALRGVTTTK